MRPRARLLETLAASGLCLAVAGCSQEAKIRQLNAFLLAPAKDANIPMASGREYRVLPPDVLSIVSIRVPEIAGVSQQVRPDGKLNLPLLGEIEVAGKTPKEIEEAIRKSAQRYYEEVDATVTVTGYNSQKIYVFGQVGAPGPVPWTGTNTLLDVLAQKQPTILAWPERIRVLRGRPPRTGGYLPTTQPSASELAKEGRNKAGAEEVTVNLMAMVRKGDLSHNIFLQPNDVVYVPAHPFAWIGLGLEQILYPVRPVLEAVRVPASVEAAAGAGQ